MGGGRWEDVQRGRLPWYLGVAEGRGRCGAGGFGLVGGVGSEILSCSRAGTRGGDAVVGEEKEEGIEESRDGSDDEGENWHGSPGGVRVDEEGVENCKEAERGGCQARTGRKLLVCCKWWIENV